MRALFISSILVAALGVSAVARAQAPSSPVPAADDDPDQRAKQLYEFGNQRYEEGRYVEAIEAFEEAHRLSGRPALLFNLANAHERMGNLAAALRRLEEYRELAPEEELKTIDRRLQNLRERIQKQREEASPEPEPSPSPEPTPTAAPPAPPAPPPAPAPTAGPMREDDEGLNGATTTGAVLLALGGAGLVAGAVVGGLTMAARSDAQDGCAGGFCTADGLDAANREGDLATTTDVLFGVGGALALGGLIAVIVGVSSDDDESDTAVTIAPTPLRGGGGLWLHTRF